MYKRGQKVVVNYSQMGSTIVLLPATIVRHIGKKKYVCRDETGHLFRIDKEHVFPSLEALEASIPMLSATTICDAATGEIHVTEFPLPEGVRQEGETLWADRKPGETPVFGHVDWMTVPSSILPYSPGDIKCRVLRQFVHPCPLRGEPAQTRELEGGVFCFESPGEGWLFTMRLDTPEGGWKKVEGD